MKSPAKRELNEQQWRERVHRASRRSGTILEFCRSEGISREALLYWQRKVSNETQVVSVSQFARVEVAEPIAPDISRQSRLDPRWVAELILHLHASGGVR